MYISLWFLCLLTDLRCGLSASAARQNISFMLPNPMPAADHIRVVTTSEGDVFVTEKHALPCVEYIARGMKSVITDIFDVSDPISHTA